MSLRITIAAILLLPGLGPQDEPPGTGADLEDKLRERLKELHGKEVFPGVSVGYVLPNGRTGTAVAGHADCEEGRLLKPADRMLSGSIGKTYVAAVTLQLVREGKLKLDEKIRRRLGKEPWFERLPNSEDLTLRMLMNHSSGIPRHIFQRKFLEKLKSEPDKVWKPEELISYVLDAPPRFAAGEGFSYADTNYILVGMIIEKATGNTYYEELAKRILKPLKLTRTEPSVKREIEGLVPGYSGMAGSFGKAKPVTVGGRSFGKVIEDGKFYFNPQMEWTGGGLVTTPLDLARWAKALYGGKVLEKSGLEAMLDARPSPGIGGRYGLGVQVRGRESLGKSYGHDGFFPGYLSTMQYFPGHKVAIAVQCNTDDVRALPAAPQKIVEELMKIILEHLDSK